VLNLQKTINGKLYQFVRVKTDTRSDTIYYSQVQNKYYLYTKEVEQGETVNVELLFLDDTAPKGTQWQTNAGTAYGFPAKCSGEIIDKDITMRIGGRTFDHVIPRGSLLKFKSF